MNHTFRTALIALAIASPAAFAEPSDSTTPLLVANNPAPYYRENGDPARWYQPVVTPRQKYDNAMIEARNALADALRECRQSVSGRAACETAARDEYVEEVSQAKTLLAAARRAG
jgi:hypothetical protein